LPRCAPRSRGRRPRWDAGPRPTPSSVAGGSCSASAHRSGESRNSGGSNRKFRSRRLRHCPSRFGGLVREDARSFGLRSAGHLRRAIPGPRLRLLTSLLREKWPDRAALLAHAPIGALAPARTAPRPAPSDGDRGRGGSVSRRIPALPRCAPRSSLAGGPAGQDSAPVAEWLKRLPGGQRSVDLRGREGFQQQTNVAP
jgi:hypothetical protein